jgi:hypothetical protein
VKERSMGEAVAGLEQGARGHRRLHANDKLMHKYDED